MPRLEPLTRYLRVEAVLWIWIPVEFLFCCNPPHTVIVLPIAFCVSRHGYLFETSSGVAVKEIVLFLQGARHWVLRIQTRESVVLKKSSANLEIAQAAYVMLINGCIINNACLRVDHFIFVKYAV